MSVVAVIPARGGSKGIPRKNLADCGGKPLLYYTAAAALGAESLTRSLLSTDDLEIQSVARGLGLESPFLRPSEIANDKSPMIGVLAHALDWFASEGEIPEAIVLLQPTSPFRTSQHIDAALEVFRKTNADTVVSVTRVPHAYTPGSLMKADTTGALTSLNPTETQAMRRQEKPALFARNGPAILIVKPSIIRTGNFYGGKTHGFEMDKRSSLDIDDPEDLVIADLLFRSRRGVE